MRNKNLFVGSAGRFEDKGGARMATTPHTILVPPEYEIETNVPDTYEFSACSLDGRLWLFTTKIYPYESAYLVALKWNKNAENENSKEKGKMELLSTKTIESDIRDKAVIAVGIDWITTYKSVYQVVNEYPYVLEASSFSHPDEAENIQIQQELKNELSNIFIVYKSFEKYYPIMYITLPWINFISTDKDGDEIDNYYIITPVFMIRKPDKKLKYGNFIINGAVSLEFEYNSEDSIQTSIYSSFQLVYFNDKIWGRGHSHIGEIFLLPRNFDEEGEVKEFYVYISPNYLREYDAKTMSFLNSDWDMMDITTFNNNLYGFINSSSYSELCQRSKNKKLYLPDQKEWKEEKEVEEEVEVFYDNVNQKALILTDKKAEFLPSNQKIESDAIKQWIIPNGTIENISNEFVISSFNNNILATHINSVFYREFLQNKQLALTINSYEKENNSNVRLSMGKHNSKISINKINSPNVTIKLKEDISKNIKIEFIKEVEIWIDGYTFDSYDYRENVLNTEIPPTQGWIEGNNYGSGLRGANINPYGIFYNSRWREYSFHYYYYAWEFYERQDASDIYPVEHRYRSTIGEREYIYFFDPNEETVKGKVIFFCWRGSLPALTPFNGPSDLTYLIIQNDKLILKDSVNESFIEGPYIFQENFIPKETLNFHINRQGLCLDRMNKALALFYFTYKYQEDVLLSIPFYFSKDFDIDTSTYRFDRRYPLVWDLENINNPQKDKFTEKYHILFSKGKAFIFKSRFFHFNDNDLNNEIQRSKLF